MTEETQPPQWLVDRAKALADEAGGDKYTRECIAKDIIAIAQDAGREVAFYFAGQDRTAKVEAADQYQQGIIDGQRAAAPAVPEPVAIVKIDKGDYYQWGPAEPAAQSADAVDARRALSIEPGPFFAGLRAMFREYGRPDSDEEKGEIKAQFYRCCADMCETWEQLRAALSQSAKE